MFSHADYGLPYEDFHVWFVSPWECPHCSDDPTALLLKRGPTDPLLVCRQCCRVYRLLAGQISGQKGIQQVLHEVGTAVEIDAPRGTYRLGPIKAAPD